MIGKDKCTMCDEHIEDGIAVTGIGMAGKPITLWTHLGCVDKARMEHAPHETIGRELGALTDKKNASYGESFKTSAEALKLLYPNAVTSGQYANMLALARVWDKMGRIATDETAFAEDPWADIAGYALLMVKRGRDANAVDNPYDSQSSRRLRELCEQLKSAPTEERIVK
jgi:hypothetical protein